MICANVSGLLLIRATARQQETAIRLALGASRGQIIRQCLTECLVLAGTGAALGFFLVWLGIPTLRQAIPPVRSVYAGFGLRATTIDLQPDLRVMFCCTFLFGLSALLSAIAPAWHACHRDPNSALKSTVSKPNQGRAQGILCIFQVAVCAVLLISASLVAHSLIKLRTLDPGFDRDHTITFSIDPAMNHYTREQTARFERRLIAATKVLPGVEAAGFSLFSVMQGFGGPITVSTPDHTTLAATPRTSSLNKIGFGYFEAMRIRLIAGRKFREDDGFRKESLPVIVNEAFARQFFHGDNPIGRQFARGLVFTKPDYYIIGERFKPGSSTWCFRSPTSPINTRPTPRSTATRPTPRTTGAPGLRSRPRCIQWDARR